MLLFLPKKVSLHSFFFSVVFILCSFYSVAQNGRVEGRVLDEVGTTIPGVIVSVDNGTQKVLSDLDGKFFFELTAGEHKINAQFIIIDRIDIG